ncbi:uncharacterized protein LOC105357688 isoform X1 [Oryzias latipes]|uniref:uncharacterized protein LOC105357688 isoform X1 n=1 Tax=Oryzias latipes TaxID=8090 RepID=UPI0009DA9620|nr:uncharacterized protein LOC105357688 isoform X1 [Oryzias latipes]
MFDFTSLHFPLFLTWMLTFTEQTFSQKTVRVGDEVTLKCENANYFNDGCSRITWLYSNSGQTFSLFELGKIHKDVVSKSDRLSLTEKCSLVIKKITDEDAGSYTCRQFSTSGQQETDFQVGLNVIKKNDVRLTRKTLKPTSKPSSASTSAAESTTTTETVLSTSKPSTATDHLSKTGLVTCLGCPLSSPTSSRDRLQQHVTPKENYVRSTRKTLKPTSKPSSASTSAAESTTTTESVLSTSKPSTATDHLSNTAPDMTAVITAAVIVAACLLVVVVLLGWRRIKVRKTQIEENMLQTPPEDVGSYASIRFSRNTNNRRQVVDKDDEGDAVTYSTVKVSSSSAHVHTDPISLH